MLDCNDFTERVGKHLTMTNKKQPKPRTVDVTMVKMPYQHDGLDLYAELDGKILGGRKSFTAKIPIRGRSLDQNALWAVFYTIIGKATGQTSVEVKAECKLNYGVPILCEQDDGFKRMWRQLFEPLSYEMQLSAMRHIGVTREFSKMNGSIYTETLQREYSKQSIILEVL